MGPLQGVSIIEFGGLGPAPFCGMMLADMGGEVIRVERPDSELHLDPTLDPSERPDIEQQEDEWQRHEHRSAGA